MPVIHIDTAELTYAWFWLPGHLDRFMDGSTPGGVGVDLPPGEYAVQQTRSRPSDVRFRVTDDGVVDYDTGHEHLLRGRGTTTLRVVGVPVTVQRAGRPLPLLPMWGGCHVAIDASEHRLRVPPGRAYEIRVGIVPSEVLAFSVGRDGVIDYAPEYERTLSGRGTDRLVVSTGYPGAAPGPSPA